MKAILLALTLITPAFAVGFDTEGFGLYDFTDAQYRTFKPTITETTDGGIYISTQVDLIAFGDAGAISHIDMTFSRGGTLLSAQLRTTVARKTIDTGLVRRPEPPVAPIAVEGQPAPKVMPFNATEELIIELFNRYDAEMRKISEGKDAEKRDLFSRFGRNKNAKSANLAAGLRHNCNLMIQHTRGH
jgi:hypothetical protein